MGFIDWKYNVYNFSMNGELDFEGLDISSVIINGDDDIFENFLDSIADIFTISESRSPYRRFLNTRMYIGAEYPIIPELRLGALSRTIFINNRIEKAITLSANADLGNWFSTSLSYSMMNNSFNNLGLGLAIRGGPFQFYIISDNFNAVFNPNTIRSINLWFGMNLVFGSAKKYQAQEPSE